MNGSSGSPLAVAQVSTGGTGGPQRLTSGPEVLGSSGLGLVKTAFSATEVDASPLVPLVTGWSWSVVSAGRQTSRQAGPGAPVMVSEFRQLSVAATGLNVRVSPLKHCVLHLSPTHA